jgi:hypothetical protein
MVYRIRCNLAVGEAHRVLKAGALLDPAWVSEAGLARLLRRGYVIAEAETPDIPVTAIRGVGPERAKNLATMGIETVAALLTADPAEIEKRMSSLSVAQIEEWQAQGHTLIEKAIADALTHITEDGGSDGREGCVRCGR